MKATAVTSAESLQTYAYGGQHGSDLVGSAVSERGLPADASAASRYDDADDCWSDGVSAPPSSAAPRATCAYDGSALLAQADGWAGTTSEPAEAHNGDLSCRQWSQVAANGALPRTSQTVDSIAERAGVGLDGVKVHILDPVADADTIRYLDLQGAVARTDDLGIQLHPNAFANEETLVKTLAHERTHVYQIKTFGDYGTGHVGGFEDAAYAIEDSFWQYYLGRGPR